MRVAWRKHASGLPMGTFRPVAEPGPVSGESCARVYGLDFRPFYLAGPANRT
jgi:hypothetical protein